MRSPQSPPEHKHYASWVLAGMGVARRLNITKYDEHSAYAAAAPTGDCPLCGMGQFAVVWDVLGVREEELLIAERQGGRRLAHTYLETQEAGHSQAAQPGPGNIAVPRDDSSVENLVVSGSQPDVGQQRVGAVVTHGVISAHTLDGAAAAEHPDAKGFHLESSKHARVGKHSSAGSHPSVTAGGLQGAPSKHQAAWLSKRAAALVAKAFLVLAV
jgi:hypothetical protein